MSNLYSQDDRAYRNKLPDVPLSPEEISNKKSRAQDVLSQILRSIDESLQLGQINTSDHSVYTGLSGLALLFLRLFQVRRDEKFLNKAAHMMERIEPHVHIKECTFLCGDCGSLAVKALIAHYRGSTRDRDDFITKITSLSWEVVTSKSLPNEMLYGRAGYLYIILFLRKHIGSTVIDKALILQIAQAIVDEGLKRGSDTASPLNYTWHDKHYMGAAHGHAGIIYTLLQVKHLFAEFDDSLLRPSIDFLLSIQFPSGNFPSSLESGERDKLVHWCHGAPGFVYMFTLAYKLYGDQKYCDAALQCSDVVWERGLLRKGFGLCHGAAGNGYTFLNVYRMANDQRQLSRAYQFAERCCQLFQIQWKPDRFYSLFEGIAGTAHFLIDMIWLDENSGFPAFEL